MILTQLSDRVVTQNMCEIEAEIFLHIENLDLSLLTFFLPFIILAQVFQTHPLRCDEARDLTIVVS